MRFSCPGRVVVREEVLELFDPFRHLSLEIERFITPHAYGLGVCRVGFHGEAISAVVFAWVYDLVEFEIEDISRRRLGALCFGLVRVCPGSLELLRIEIYGFLSLDLEGFGSPVEGKFWEHLDVVGNFELFFLLGVLG